MADSHRRLLIACIVLIFAGGCASYRQRVADDFRDAFQADVGVGVGLYAHAKATSYLDAAVGWGGYWQNVGLESRYTPLVHPSLNGCLFPFGLIPGALPHDSPLTALRLANLRDTCRTDHDGEYAVAGQLFDATAIGKWDAYGIAKRSPHEVLHDGQTTYTDHPLGFEAGVGLLVVNVRVGFDPVEFCDLICTLFGYDLLHDNPPTKPNASASKPSD